jgi:hypothetical protein
MTVKITTGFIGRKQARIELFATTFTTSEGPDAGALIADLVRDLPAETPTGTSACSAPRMKAMPLARQSSPA